ncbi:hypothetical protein C8R47DRAFT_1075625 [Mycena vitilis]|nr:hypothetical protein C8R47DRAFT_1075625 [Mycena vitilis]
MEACGKSPPGRIGSVNLNDPTSGSSRSLPQLCPDCDDRRRFTQLLREVYLEHYQGGYSDYFLPGIHHPMPRNKVGWEAPLNNAVTGTRAIFSRGKKFCHGDSGGGSRTPICEIARCCDGPLKDARRAPRTTPDAVLSFILYVRGG